MDIGCEKPGTTLKLESFCVKPIQFIPIPDQPERLNPETLDKEKDDEMGKYYISNIKLTEMR
jgi:hypothetical protein